MAAPSLRLDHLTILVSSMETSRRFHDVLLPMLGFTRTTRETSTPASATSHRPGSSSSRPSKPASACRIAAT